MSLFNGVKIHHQRTVANTTNETETSIGVILQHYSATSNAVFSKLFQSCKIMQQSWRDVKGNTANDCT